MRPKEIFMHSTVIGSVIYGGRHCHRAKIFYLPQPGIEPRSLDLQANTLPCRCKSRLLPQGSRCVCIHIYLDPVTLTSHQLLRSYGNKATGLSLLRQRDRSCNQWFTRQVVNPLHHSSSLNININRQPPITVAPGMEPRTLRLH